jgi:uncharacterized protein (DUF2267 family)
MQIVEHDAGTLERANRATRATLETLAERLSAGEARDLAAQLPTEIAPWLGTDTGVEPFDLDEFLRRMAARSEVDVETARRYASAVFRALAQAVTAEEYRDMVSELPKSFASILPRGPDLRVVGADAFLQRVADRAAVDLGAARTATDAVLETLGERISAGEVKNLIERLPLELHEPLARGVANADKATRMSLEDFIARVAERESVSLDQALEHTRAVLVTLKEALGDEFFDVTAQLPQDYAAVLNTRAAA